MQTITCNDGFRANGATTLTCMNLNANSAEWQPAPGLTKCGNVYHFHELLNKCFTQLREHKTEIYKCANLNANNPCMWKSCIFQSSGGYVNHWLHCVYYF